MAHLCCKICQYNKPVIFPGAVVGLYSGASSLVGDLGCLAGDLFDPLPGLLVSIPDCDNEGVSLSEGVPLPWGEVTL